MTAISDPTTATGDLSATTPKNPQHGQIDLSDAAGSGAPARIGPRHHAGVTPVRSTPDHLSAPPIAQVLVLAAVHPDSGPGKKMAALAAAFDTIGCPTRTMIVAPDRRAQHRLHAALTAGPRPDLVVLRSHWTLPLLTPALHRLQAAGTRVVLDSPSPVAAGVREITGSRRSSANKLVRLGVETAWTPLAWPTADVIVQYELDGWPWRTLARRRRLTLTNGVDVARLPLAAGWAERTTYHLVAAGTLAQWHGYDRLLAGLPSHPEATLTVVGDGPELPALRALAAAHRLGTGTLTGAAFDAVMAAADVGVSSLGEHRRGSFALSPLKTRDYLARGLPLVSAGDDPDLRDDPNFVYRAPVSDRPLDLRRITAWLDRLRHNPCVTPQTIRSFALAHLDMTQRAAAILAACN